MGAAKDLVIATVILAACIVLLVLVFGQPQDDALDDGTRMPRVAGTDPAPATGTTPAPGTGTDVRIPTPPRVPPAGGNGDSSTNGGRSGASINLRDIMVEDPPPPARVQPGVRTGIEVLTGIPPVAGPGPGAAPTPVPTPPPTPPTRGTGLDDLGTRVTGTTPTLPPVTTPTPTRPDRTPPGTGQRSHTIAGGDELARISQHYYGTTRYWQRIAEANPGVDPNRLVVGKTLVIPEIADLVTPDRLGTVSADGGSYIIQSGDNYWVIADRVLGNAARHTEIAALNPGVDPDRLKVGDVIKLPPRGATVTAPRPPEPRATTLPPGAREHLVESGDILGDLSQRYYGTSRKWRVIADANGITDDGALRVGTRLVIPDAGSPARAEPAVETLRNAPARPAPAGAGPGRWHVIARGDTFQTISQQYFGTVRRAAAIAAANPDRDPTRLQVGVKVWVPEASGEARSAPAGATPPASGRGRRSADMGELFPLTR